MSKTISVIALLCTILSITSAVVVYEDSSFSEIPVRVLNNTDTTNFAYPFVGRYTDSTYFALWGFYGDSDTAPITYNAYLRLLNSSDLTVVGDDTAVTLNISLVSQPVFASSTDGYVVIAGVSQTVSGTTTNTTTNVATNVYQTSVVAAICSSDTTKSSLKFVTFGATTDSTVNYTVYQVWFDDSYFFIAYTQLNSHVETAVYLVGFKTDGSSEFGSPLQLNRNSLTGTSGLQASSSNGTLIATWRKSTQTQVVYVELDLSSTAVGTEVVLATDTDIVTFYPSAIVFAQNYYVILLSQVTNGDAVSLTASYSGNTTTSTLNFTLASGYNTFTVTAYGQYFDGWFIFTRQIDETGNTISATEETLQVYNFSGYPNSSNSASTSNSTNSTSNSTTQITVNNTQLTLILDGSVIQGFTLPNQSYFVLVLNDLQGQGGAWTHGYIAQVFSKVSENFATVVKSALIFIFTTAAFYLLI